MLKLDAEYPIIKIACQFNSRLLKQFNCVYSSEKLFCALEGLQI